MSRYSLRASIRAGLVLACLTAHALAAQEGVIFHDAPVASWIAPPAVPADSYVVFHARRAIELPTVPPHVVVHLSGDNRYRFYVNGTSASSGPQRSDVTHWRYETIDIAPMLHAGRNVLAAVV